MTLPVLHPAMIDELLARIRAGEPPARRRAAPIVALVAVGIAAWLLALASARIEDRPPATAGATPSPVLIVVPEPDPATLGILLDRWSRASAPLVPLN